MADHNLRKVSDSGVGYSVVDLNDVRHVYAAAAPLAGNSFDEQADDALRTIQTVIGEEGKQGSIVHQAVFLADMSQVARCQQNMRDFYGPELPATSYIPQPPAGGKLLAIEALGVGRGHGEVQIERLSDDLVIARHNGIAWVHCTKNVPESDDRPVYEGSLRVFQDVCRTFGRAKVRFDQVIRTWIYLGGIVENDGPVQRYKELNRARTDFFRDMHFLNGRAPNSPNRPIYPASTGIGTAGRGVVLSAIAFVSDRREIRAVPLENPRQTAAYDYAACYSPESPKFSRAMVLSCGTYTTIFISGTASITNSLTRHIGDAVKQTEETLDNIAALIAEENLARHGLPGLGTSLASLAFARVYIKHAVDYPGVRAVCEQRLGVLPTIYAIADVCRPELLVEIEGVAFSRLDP